MTVRAEFGVSGEMTILPSTLIYPGELNDVDHLCTDDEVISEMYLCDEGGRFYLNDNHFQVLRAKKNMPIQEDQVWISAVTLKKLLKMSNKVSIQLRCLSSLIVKYLNPEVARSMEKMQPVLSY